MAPKPKPLQQEDIVIDGHYGSSDSGQNVAQPVSAGGKDLRNQSQPQQHQPIQEPRRAALPIPWFMRKDKEQRDPNGHVVSGKSPSSFETNKADPPESKQSGILTREGDFLDRTFDNVENVTCHRTSMSEAPPEPIFSCTPLPVENDAAADIVALSSAKQQSYNIEQYDEDGNENEIQEKRNTPSPVSARPPLVPVNSILIEEQNVDVMPSESANTEKAVQAERSGHKRDMLDYLFENVQSMMCREDPSPAIGPNDTQQVKLPQVNAAQFQCAAPAAVQVEDEGVTQDEEGGDSPMNLHQIISDNPNSDGLVNACDSIFATGKSNDASEAPSSRRREPFAPIRYTDSTPSSHGRPRTGMMLLADGSIVVPEATSQRWARQAQRSARSTHSGGTSTLSSQHWSKSPSSAISMIRESSLLDMASGSVDEPGHDGQVRRSSLRDKKRAVSKRVSHGGTQTIIIPPRDYDEEQAQDKHGATAEESLENQYFWKQVAFASTILLLACGLIIFALSFFWPAEKLR
jgi:hypothetical protein